MGKARSGHAFLSSTQQTKRQNDSYPSGMSGPSVPIRVPVTVYTCGHSTRSFDELTDLLRRNGITLLVDVRAIPRSRFYPHFNRSYLEQHLPIPYLWREHLGGKNAKSVPKEVFDAGIGELLALAAEEKVCIMCSERSPTPTKHRPEGCHRWNAIAPALIDRGARVVHL